MAVHVLTELVQPDPQVVRVEELKRAEHGVCDGRTERAEGPKRGAGHIHPLTVLLYNSKRSQTLVHLIKFLTQIIFFQRF